MKTIVFLGPTLSLSVAKAIYPDALFHDPVKCGDIIQALRLKPKRMLIIDGYYENVPAVWHKEILLAISEGVIVYGASSMGALRAAELKNFGMRGIGKVFQYYVSHECDADDEVAVLHHHAQLDFESINDALVNIRETLKLAVKKSMLTEDQYLELIDIGKLLPYPQRNFNKIITAAELLTETQKGHLINWLNNGNKIDIKKEDAILSLRALFDNKALDGVQHTHFSLEKTTLLRRLMRSVNTDVFSKYYDHLPAFEKKLIHYKHVNLTGFKLFSDTAFLCSVCYEMMNNDSVERNTFDDYFNFEELLAWLDSQLQGEIAVSEQIIKFKEWVRILYDVELENFCLPLYAKIWFVLMLIIKKQKIKVAKADVDRTFNQLVRAFKKLNHESLMSSAEYRQMMMHFIFLKIIFFESRFDFFGISNAPLCPYEILHKLGSWLDAV